MEERKQKEREFTNQLLAGGKQVMLRPSNRFYSISRRSNQFVLERMLARAKDALVLDYGCGDGSAAILAAKGGATAFGIDISDVTVGNAKQWAAHEKVDGKAHFLVMDGESLAFVNDSFDLIIVRAILHHLKLDVALSELARVLKPDGAVLCSEGLANNPLIQLYRRMTPSERTEWEIDNLLRVRDLEIVKEYFGQIETRFFHLATLAAVPFRNSRIFSSLLSVLEAIDSFALRLPLVQKMAWQIVMILQKPKKALRASS